MIISCRNRKRNFEMQYGNQKRGNAMSKDELLKQQLTAIIADMEKHPNIWASASIEVEPEK